MVDELEQQELAISHEAWMEQWDTVIEIPFLSNKLTLHDKSDALALLDMLRDMFHITPQNQRILSFYEALSKKRIASQTLPENYRTPVASRWSLTRRQIERLCRNLIDSWSPDMEVWSDAYWELRKLLREAGLLVFHENGAVEQSDVITQYMNTLPMQQHGWTLENIEKLTQAIRALMPAENQESEPEDSLKAVKHCPETSSETMVLTPQT